jgi:hypothetical protein
MPPASIRITGSELAELERLTRAQVEAARAADVEALGALLDARRQLLESLRGRAVSSQDLEPLLRLDAETQALVRERVQSVEGALARARQGGRALGGYAARIAAPVGFIDQLR